MNDQEAPKIGRYLLGELPPEEMDALEARLLTESGLFDLAEAVEDDIVDRYVRGEMSAAETQRFERRLLPSARIQERVAFARALAERGTKKPVRQEETPRRRALVFPLFRAPARLAWAATLVACLAAGALGFEVFQLRDETASLERARAGAVAELVKARETKAQPETPVESVRTLDQKAERLTQELSAARERISELEAQEAAQAERRIRHPGKIESGVAPMTVFVPATTRGSSEPTRVQVGEGDGIELQLELGPERPQGMLRAMVRRGDQPVLQEAEVPVESVEGESVAKLELPSRILFDGLYHIEVFENETGEVVGTYDISIKR